MSLASLGVARGFCRYSCPLLSNNCRTGLFRCLVSTSKSFEKSSKAREMARQRVFFDMTADGEALGRIVIEVCILIFFFICDHDAES